MTAQQRPVRVVILGGGFAGISTARELGRRVRDDSGVEVHLICDEIYFVFQPLLPEVVSCGLEPSHIVNPIRHLCPHVHFHCAAVQSIDDQTRTVTMVGSDLRRVHSLEYDHLILCLGQTMDLGRIPGMTEHSLPIKTLGDAFALRNHVLSRLEEADIESDAAAQRRLLTIVTVGGGFSGVETVAELNDMIKSVMKFYPRARAAGARTVLIHSRERILNELGEELGAFAEKKLSQRGVEIILKSRVAEATSEGVTLADGRMILAGTVVSTVGNAPHPLLRTTSFPQDKGRILVDELLRVQNRDNVWALGDAAMIPDTRRGGFCPPTAQYAMREGTCCAQNVLAAIRGRPLQPFTFGGLGQLAVVGRRCGVAQIFGFKFAGLFAWWLWRSVYFAKLPGLRCKIRVGIDWSLDLFFPRDITKIDTQRTERLHRAHFRQGECIIRQGEIADRFYIIESGEVEVLRQDDDQPERRLSVRIAGQSFGEIALLTEAPRTATVRCLTPVDVITFNRDDFRTFVGSYEPIRILMNEQLRACAPGTRADVAADDSRKS